MTDLEIEQLDHRQKITMIIVFTFIFAGIASALIYRFGGIYQLRIDRSVNKQDMCNAIYDANNGSASECEIIEVYTLDNGYLDYAYATALIHVESLNTKIKTKFKITYDGKKYYAEMIAG